MDSANFFTQIEHRRPPECKNNLKIKSKVPSARSSGRKNDHFLKEVSWCTASLDGLMFFMIFCWFLWVFKVVMWVLWILAGFPRF